MFLAQHSHNSKMISEMTSGEGWVVSIGMVGPISFAIFTRRWDGS